MDPVDATVTNNFALFNTGRLSLAWELVGHNDIPSVMKHFKYNVKELDLSNNGLT